MGSLGICPLYVHDIVASGKTNKYLLYKSIYATWESTSSNSTLVTCQNLCQRKKNPKLRQLEKTEFQVPFN